MRRNGERKRRKQRERGTERGSDEQMDIHVDRDGARGRQRERNSVGQRGTHQGLGVAVRRIFSFQAVVVRPAPILFQGYRKVAIAGTNCDRPPYYPPNWSELPLTT